jgi:DNA-binding GntR family transcriptional regulator
MDTTEHLRLLGEETLYIETVYLNLKIEKALKGDDFTRDNLLEEAEALWKEIDSEYYSFLTFLQNNNKYAA